MLILSQRRTQNNKTKKSFIYLIENNCFLHEMNTKLNRMQFFTLETKKLILYVRVYYLTKKHTTKKNLNKMIMMMT